MINHEGALIAAAQAPSGLPLSRDSSAHNGWHAKLLQRPVHQALPQRHNMQQINQHSMRMSLKGLEDRTMQPLLASAVCLAAKRSCYFIYVCTHQQITSMLGASAASSGMHPKCTAQSA
eukprot:53394-Pelagomonas_calceolata.AAC.2